MFLGRNQAQQVHLAQTKMTKIQVQPVIGGLMNWSFWCYPQKILYIYFQFRADKRYFFMSYLTVMGGGGVKNTILITFSSSQYV